MRRVLFELLAKKFGPYSTWEKASTPGHGREEEFRIFCEQFAQVVGAKSWKAVINQIFFALPEPEGGKGSTWKAQVQIAIMCKAAALEMGFIGSAQLPELHAKYRLPDDVEAVSLDDPAEVHSAIERSVS